MHQNSEEFNKQLTEVAKNMQASLETQLSQIDELIAQLGNKELEDEFNDCMKKAVNGNLTPEQLKKKMSKWL